MIQVLSSSWALLLGMMLLLLGNGMQGSLLGIRGGIEGFSTYEMSLVMSAYFVGFLGGSRMAPGIIRRVGHVRAFAALGSFTSAILILYPAITDPWVWTALRVLFGFCFSGLYVTAESWLNNSVDNANRGKALSLYVIVQMAGIIMAQGILVLGDPSGFILFIVPSVLVSLSFAPILLSVAPSPTFESTQPMSLAELWGISQLGCVGIFLLGGVFSALFGMASVYATEAGFSVPQISLFVATIFSGGLLMQYPIGWLSDRIDRRILIMATSLVGGAVSLLSLALGGSYGFAVAAAFVIGGTANPLYALLLAYTNDRLDGDKMAGASGGLIFINGIGAATGPLITGWMMTRVGPMGFWLFIGILMGGMTVYSAWRMALRPGTKSPEETVPYAPVIATATPVAVGVAEEFYAESLSEIGSDPATEGAENVRDA